MFVEKAKKMGRSVSFVAQLDKYVFSHSHAQYHSSLSYLTYVQEYIEAWLSVKFYSFNEVQWTKLYPPVSVWLRPATCYK